ncbi:hypothetical protein MYX04_12940, partial [Nitrospiraceae bacterium AH_259_D15_M11_P09]|nr:hypothetical protein [Nitrospiraceae bacterium AH_259_D15_M11_P09]
PPAPADTPHRRSDAVACSQGLLECQGYRVLRVTGRGQPWDLIGFKTTDMLLCHVVTQGSPADLDALAAFPAPESVPKVVHVYEDGQAAPVVHALSSDRVGAKPGGKLIGIA